MALFGKYVIVVRDNGRVVHVELSETEYLQKLALRRLRRRFVQGYRFELHESIFTKAHHRIKSFHGFSRSDIEGMAGGFYPVEVLLKASENERQCVEKNSKLLGFLFRKYHLWLIAGSLALLGLYLPFLGDLEPDGQFGVQYPTTLKYLWLTCLLGILICFALQWLSIGFAIFVFLFFFGFYGLISEGLELWAMERAEIARGGDPRCLPHKDPDFTFRLEHSHLCGYSRRWILEEKRRIQAAVEREAREITRIYPGGEE